MKHWWYVNVEDRLNRLPVNWDTLFVYTWLWTMTTTLLSGGA